MTEPFETVKLRILGENHTIACEPEDRELLKNAAPVLDEHIEAVQRQDPLLDITSVFMLAGLKLATTLLQSQRTAERSGTETLDSVRSVRRRVERRLEKVAADGSAKARAAG